MSVFADAEARVAKVLRRAGLRDVSPVVVRGAIIGLTVLVGLALWRWWPVADQAPPEFPSSQSAEKPAPSSIPSVSTEPSVGVLVHVVGAVRRPGVYELAAQSRVIDAVEAAGGTLPDAVLTAVNMARIIADGEQILIPDEDMQSAGTVSAPAAAPGGSTAPGAATQVNINSADAAALEELPGVGPSTAAKIVADRESNGPFKTVEDLGRVSGIGPKKLEQMTSFICVQ